MCGQLEHGQLAVGVAPLAAPGRLSVLMGTSGVLAVTQPAGTALSETCSLAKLAQTLGEIVESPSLIYHSALCHALISVSKPAVI